MNRLIAFVSLIGFLISCSESPNEKPIQQVDSLLIVVAGAQGNLASLNSNDYSSLIDTVKQDVQFIQSQYPDTMDLQTAFKVDYYYRTIKSVRKFSETYSSQNSELNYTMTQLNNLKNDLSNEIFDKESFVEIFPSESKAVARHKESVENLKSWHESIGMAYNRHKPGIDSLIVYIKESVD
jgi:hypothetical protein